MNKIVSHFGPALRWSRMRTLAGILSILSFSAVANAIDFGYSITQGGTPLRLVYDDGSKTYLVLAKGTDTAALEEIAQAVMVVQGGEVHPATLDLSSPNPFIVGVYDQIVLAVGGQQAVATHIGSHGQSGARERPTAEKTPSIEAGERTSPQKIPAQETREDGVVEAVIPVKGPAINPVPETAAPPVGPPSLETKEVLSAPQVVKVVAKAEEPPSPKPVPAAMPDPVDTNRAAANSVGEYKVMVPFAIGKTVLGKEGEKAMDEIIHIGQIAKEIRIRAPRDPGSDFQRAHLRAAEIHKLLAKAGLVRQRISIEAIDTMPNSKSVQAEVALLVDLGKGNN